MKLRAGGVLRALAARLDRPGGRVAAWPFVLAAVLLSLAAYWYHPALLERFDQRGRDLALRLRKPPPPPPELVLVVIDERAVKRYGRWPWPRTLQAKLIRRLKQAGAATVALDITYVKSEGAAQDAALVQALAAPGAPVVGAYFFRARQAVACPAEALAALRPSRIRQVLLRPGADPAAIPALPYVESSQPACTRAMGRLGFFNVVHDPDGLVRSAPLVMRYGDAFYPSLPLAALAVYLEREIGLVVSAEGAERVRLGDRAVPVDRFGELPLNFYAGARPLPSLSAAEVLDGTADARLRGRLVFVGITELGLADMRPTPVHPNFPGVAVHATVAGNILQGFFLYRDYRAVAADVALMALLPLLVVGTMTRLRRPLPMAGTLALHLALGWGAVQLLLVRAGLLVSLVYPFLAAVIGAVLFQLWYVLSMQRRTRFLRRAFASYVSPDLVRRLVEHPEELTLTGEKRELTVLFSDIRDFTALSESLPPERLVRLLNRYLGRMTDIVLEEQGTLDKYIGDALMAVYNAPLAIPGHAARAASSALHMLHALEALNRELEVEYGVRLRIGIGLHCGEAIIGNLGSERRFEYTAIGDTVNLASRLEGRTKAYGVPVVISGALRRRLDGRFHCRRLDRVRVKGKRQAVELYQLMDGDPDADRELAQRFEAALGHYFEGRFEAALAGFEESGRRFPDDGPSRLFAERCRGFLLQPPPADWDGVFVAGDK